jgi:hypothetical protein
LNGIEDHAGVGDEACVAVAGLFGDPANALRHGSEGCAPSRLQGGVFRLEARRRHDQNTPRVRVENLGEDRVERGVEFSKLLRAQINVGRRVQADLLDPQRP